MQITDINQILHGSPIQSAQGMFRAAAAHIILSSTAYTREQIIYRIWVVINTHKLVLSIDHELRSTNKQINETFTSVHK